MSKVLFSAPIVVIVFLLGVPLYGVPATLSLPAGIRPGLEPLSISEAARQLQRSGESGWDLVEAARSLVEERMAYSRRNSFDNFGRAFERGYGYCGQTAFALEELLKQIGFEARVVQAFENRFPDGTVSSHAWVQVVIDGQVRNVDSLFYDANRGMITFTPLSEITEIPLMLKVLMDWGAPAVNAHRYYLTGKDQDW
jgi:transglutaminase-like putative cysteine protease